ncbi:MAG: hypothetical protein Q9222_003836 [Ikaeria aurantiellina]
MGVTGLWSIVQPCARPTDISTLNRKRLAVDASIWIYQFLKAVRDKEGNALRNSHVVGFFRRICKLLFFGIKPVFVFDGGAPVLKRQTVTSRKRRREGRREDAVRTAGRLLAVQMQRRAEEGEERRKRDEEEGRAHREEEEEAVPEDGNLVYVDEIQMTAQERQQNRQFKKKDAYHLPNLDVSLAEMGAPNDPRIMSHEELEEYARQFHTGEDVNVYDFSKIDFNGPFFQSLPASDRYNILNAARLRSRLRMGYSKEQLDTMFPDRMAFSKFQVERVRERNELTQRLMNINGMNGDDTFDGGGRVAGEKGKEYVLVKNDGVEGGWALGVVSNKGDGERNKPIDVDGYGKPPKPEEMDISEEETFEDVPVEGLNRLPKSFRNAPERDYNDDYDPDEISKKRRAVYERRLEATAKLNKDKEPENSQYASEEAADGLFLPEEITEQDLEAEADEDLFEDVPPPAEDEEEELNRAIAMSLEDPETEQESQVEKNKFVDLYSGPGIDKPLEYNLKSAELGRNFAHLTNARAHGAAPKPFRNDSDEDDDEDFNLQAALEESRQSMRKPHTGPRVHGFKRPDEPASLPLTTTKAVKADQASPAKSAPSQNGGFSGPLPFQSLDLGKSILGRKKKPVPEEEAGGFEQESEELQLPKERPPQPLPPWFTGEIPKDKLVEDAQKDGEDHSEGEDDLALFQMPTKKGPLVRQQTGEVIDLDAPAKISQDIIAVDSSGDEGEGEVISEGSRPVDDEVKMGEVADLTRVSPPQSSIPTNIPEHLGKTDKQAAQQVQTSSHDLKEGTPDGATDLEEHDDEEPIEWEESDVEADKPQSNRTDAMEIPAGGELQSAQTKSPSPEFEDVDVTASAPERPAPLAEQHIAEPLGLPHDESIDILPAEDEDNYSDPEDEDLMRQLAIEAEEHARFASTLNSKPQAQNIEEYEKELRQLRTQQKKDRRDADEVTHVMVTECQQLLKLFGLPYITAPMEAEAQCAELVALGLVDGIVTDDSDIFLFGGTRVYKNMFNQAKFVECYLMSDLEKEYSLTRPKLIGVAHLLGSDYTEGIPSVGPVTALEILSEFESLEEFAEWCNHVQLAQKLSVEDSANPFRRKFRKQAQKLFLPSQFPDKRVDFAYLNPEVDADPSSFEWGVPDLDALRSFLMATIGWTQERTDEVLVPVIRDMNRRDNEGTQANITQFFSGGTGVGARPGGKTNANNTAFAPRRRVEGKSRRMETALGRLHEQARKRTIGEREETRVDGAGKDANESSTVNGTTAGEERGQRDKQAKPKQTRKRAAPKDTSNPASDVSDDANDDDFERPKRANQGTKKKGVVKPRGSKRSKAG